MERTPSSRNWTIAARQAGAVAALAWAAAGGPAIAAELPIGEIAERSRPSIVEIVGALENTGETSYGTGFVFHEPGLVVTNAHVIQGTASLMVRTYAGALLASVVVLELREDLDLAILRVTGLESPPLPLSGTTGLAVGEPVVAIGHPRGYEYTVSDGIVSAIRSLRPGSIELIQTTTPISPGSSGGPLLDRRGRVAGVCSLTLAEGQNINFAVPATHLETVVAAALEIERGLSPETVDARLPAATLARMIRRHRESGDLTRAEELLRRGLALHPEDLVLLEEAAEVAWSRGRHTEVRGIVERLDTLRPGYAPARQLRAALLAEEGRCPDAVGEAEASLAAGLPDGKAAEAHAVLAECLGRMGEVSRALVHVDAALAETHIAELPDYHALRAFLLQAAGRDDAADGAAVDALVASGWDPLVVAALRERGLPRLVEVLNTRGEQTAGGFIVRGVVRNRGPVAVTRVLVTAEGFDEEGALVATGTAESSPAGLVPGQTASFEVRLGGAPEDVATFAVRIVDVGEP